MDNETIEACNRVWQDLKIDRFNQRMEHIRRCFEYDRFLSVDIKSLKTDPLYYNHYFDTLMAMSLEELEEWEIKMFKISKDYGDTLNERISKKNSII